METKNCLCIKLYNTTTDLNLAERTMVARNRSYFERPQFDITSLIPNTRYTVRIQTLDGSSQMSEKVDKHFRTKEVAGKR